MLRSVNDLIGYTINAKDGEIGKVDEFLFDDLTWSIRYLVAETGNWLFDRKILIPHAALGKTDWESRTFQVNLTMEQVLNSPVVDTEKTVNRKHEMNLFTHYKIPHYWRDVYCEGPMGTIPMSNYFNIKKMAEDANSIQQHHGHVQLRSTKKVMGYQMHAIDGEIGHVEDCIVDEERWNLYFLVVGTDNWLIGRKVLISLGWINRIDGDEAKVFVNFSKELIKNSPEYDYSQPIGQEYATELINHYGKHPK
jgi:hypothetical protein